MAFECPRRSSPPSPMFDADTGCIATDPAPSARRRFRSKTGIENLPANEHAQETPHTPSPTRTTRRIQSGCAGSRPRLRDGMPGSPSQHIDITRAKWIPYIDQINIALLRIQNLNEKVASTMIGTGDASEFLDLRDAELAKVAERITVSTYVQSDGRLVVLAGSGTPLLDQQAWVIDYQPAAVVQPGTLFSDNDTPVVRYCGFDSRSAATSRIRGCDGFADNTLANSRLAKVANSRLLVAVGSSIATFTNIGDAKQPAGRRAWSSICPVFGDERHGSAIWHDCSAPGRPICSISLKHLGHCRVRRNADPRSPMRGWSGLPNRNRDDRWSGARRPRGRFPGCPHNLIWSTSTVPSSRSLGAVIHHARRSRNLCSQAPAAVEP